MRNLFSYCVIIIFLLASCRNSADNKSSAERNKSDSGTLAVAVTKSNEAENVKLSENHDNKSGSNTAGAKSVEVEIIKINPGDSTHKLSFFSADRKYFHRDSLYCELLYNLKEVKSVAKESSPDGDYVSMMIDDRPQGSSQYYQIAVYRIRVKLDKMDRIDSYRIDVKTKLIEKHDVVRDRWILVKE